MSRIHVGALLAAVCLTSAVAAQPSSKDARERGAAAVRDRVGMNPAVWSAGTYVQLWKRWDLAEKPVNYARAVQERYGLHAAPYDNDGLPMGLHYARGYFGKGVVNDCLLCHAGRVAGQTIIGAGNASLDLQGLFEDLTAIERLPIRFPFQFSYVRGSVDVVNPVVFLMQLRDPDLNLQKPTKLDYHDHVSSDPPAWWLLKRKATRNWTGGVRTDSLRIDMVNLLSPLNGPAHIKKHATTFADIHAFVMSVEAPKYPFPIDAKLAAVGRGLFLENCARCHGTHGPDGKYPSKVVPLDTIGTDRTLAMGISRKNLDYLNRSWFGQEQAPDGRHYQIVETAGYQAPPLDGVWATAPYFHNGSVPTLLHVLNSKTRPRLFTRSYRTDRDDYDTERVGWKFQVLDAVPAKLSGYERRKIYDTTLPGLSNAGHTFGDRFTDDERRAVVEYLKTL